MFNPNPHLLHFLLQGKLALAGLRQLHIFAVELLLPLGQTAKDLSELPADCLGLLAQRLQLSLGALLLPGCLEGDRGSRKRRERDREMEGEGETERNGE